MTEPATTSLDSFERLLRFGEMSRSSSVRKVSQAEFPTFIADAWIAIVRVGSAASGFSPAVAKYFIAEYGDDVALGFFDRNEVPTPLWLLRHVGPLFAEQPAEAPSGYYLFVDGEVTGFHLGAQPQTYDTGTLIVGLFTALASDEFAAKLAASRDAHHAAELIDHFEAILARQDGNEDEPEPAVEESRDPYQILGIPASSTNAQVKAAWRKAMAENHPDRVEQMSAAIRDVAKRESQAANRAYLEIRALRGLR